MQNNPNYTINHTKNRNFVQVPISADPALVNNALSGLLTQEGYSVINYTENGVNEVVWKKGIGLASAMKFIELLYQPNLLTIVAWVSSGIGSWTTSEMSLKGVFGSVPKKSCMKTVEKAIQTAQSIVPQPQQNTIPTQPQQ